MAGAESAVYVCFVRCRCSGLEQKGSSLLAGARCAHAGQVCPATVAAKPVALLRRLRGAAEVQNATCTPPFTEYLTVYQWPSVL